MCFVVCFDVPAFVGCTVCVREVWAERGYTSFQLSRFAPRRHKDATVVPAGDGLDVGSASAAAAKEFLGLTGLTETTKPGAGVLT